jgi:hypothetical protein
MTEVAGTSPATTPQESCVIQHDWELIFSVYGRTDKPTLEKQ